MRVQAFICSELASLFDWNWLIITFKLCSTYTYL